MKNKKLQKGEMVALNTSLYTDQSLVELEERLEMSCWGDTTPPRDCSMVGRSGCPGNCGIVDYGGGNQTSTNPW